MNDFENFPIVEEGAFKFLKNSGLKGFSCDRREYLTHVSMSSIWLFLFDTHVLRLTSEMHDLKGWDEVGSIVVDVVPLTDDLPQMIELPCNWADIASVEKLIIREDAYFQAESGIKISNSAGEKIIICNAAAPCEVTMEAPFFHDKFKPEYDIGKYEFFAVYGK
jgi:hypothetical protein